LANLFYPEKVYATTGTFYPDADPETSTVDGRITYDTTGTTWNTAVTATAGHFLDDSTDILDVATSYWLDSTSRAQNNRGWFLFDTSSLTSSATISSAIISLYKYNSYDGDNDANGYTVIVSGKTPASNTALVLGDYDQVGSTALSNTIDTTIFATGYNDYTLNATGLGEILKTGISYFATREGHDLNNDQPLNSTNNGIAVRMADDVGTSQDPKLVVTYTLPITPKQNIIWFD